jgi:hypothetical protein
VKDHRRYQSAFLESLDRDKKKSDRSFSLSQRHASDEYLLVDMVQ